MSFGYSLREGSFLRRLNRFAALVELEEGPVVAHVPNSGRLEEIFTPGNRVWLARQRRPEDKGAGHQRKTDYDLVLAECEGTLVSVDARMPNRLVRHLLEQGRMPGFGPGAAFRAEAPYGDSRIDFAVEWEGQRWLLEAKSVTLVEDGTALFPDAPTERGARHLRHLGEAVASGFRAAAIFVVQRPDALRFSPHKSADPRFAAALREAAGAGVEIRAYTCQVDFGGIALDRSIPALV